MLRVKALQFWRSEVEKWDIKELASLDLIVSRVLERLLSRVLERLLIVAEITHV